MGPLAGRVAVPGTMAARALAELVTPPCRRPCVWHWVHSASISRGTRPMLMSHCSRIWNMAGSTGWKVAVARAQKHIGWGSLHFAMLLLKTAAARDVKFPPLPLVVWSELVATAEHLVREMAAKLGCHACSNTCWGRLKRCMRCHITRSGVGGLPAAHFQPPLWCPPTGLMPSVPAATTGTAMLTARQPTIPATGRSARHRSAAADRPELQAEVEGLQFY